MAPFNLKFYRLAEKTPKDGEAIFYISSSSFYGDYGIEYGEVSHQYEEIDEDGGPTGAIFGEKPTNIKTELMVCVGSLVLEDPNLLWCPATSVDKLLTKAEDAELV